MSDDTCQHECDDGSSCANPAGEDGYCYLDAHRPDPAEESGKVAEAEGKDLSAVEGKAIDVLTDEMASGTGPNARVRAAESVLEHVRWREGGE